MSGAFVYDGEEIEFSEAAKDQDLAVRVWKTMEQLQQQAALQKQMALWTK